MSATSEHELPRRRWYDSDGGQAASAAIRVCAMNAVRRLDEGHTAAALEILNEWEHTVDASPLSVHALHSVRAALADAHRALERGQAEDCRAFVRAAIDMLRGG